MKKFASALLVFLFLFASASAQMPKGKGYVPLSPQKRAALYKQSRKDHGSRIRMMSQNQTIPDKFDCRDKGWVLPIGDQADCGSCYLYSTVYGTMTSAFVKAGYGKADGSFVMSVQYGMDCHNFGGCNGGNGTEVIDWACRNGWYAEKWVDVDGKVHNDYPAYEASSRACRKVAGAKVWMPASWGFVSSSQNRPATTLEIKTALVNFGPLNVSLDAGGQFMNGTGTITSLGRSINHEIELIAFDDNHDNGNGTKGAFLLKNQWTNQWGNGGVRWVTYTAAQNLVDVFFVTAAELPPPPPPAPDPPGPGPGPLPPGTDNSIVITIGGVSQKYLLVDPTQRQADIDALQEILSRMKSQITPKVDPPKVEPKVEPKETKEPQKADCDCVKRYELACERAVREKRKLAVLVDTSRPQVGGLLNVYMPKLEGYDEPCVVVCSPDSSGWLKVDRVLPPTATDREILGLSRPVDPRSVPRQVD